MASRGVRLQEAINSFDVSSIEELKEELEEWLENMPENLQGGEKASQLEEAIEAIEEIIQAFSTIEDAEVEFPGMY